MFNLKDKFLLSSGYSIIVLAVLIELISTIFFVSGIPISAFNFWVPLLATAIFLRFMSMYNQESTRSDLWNLGLLAVIFIVGSFFSYLFYDVSYDGQAYQQEAIIQIANGWNPYRGIPVEGYVHDLWINHLPKGSWVLSASFYKVTGFIETAKVFNFALLVSSCFITIGTLYRLIPKQKAIVLITSLLLAANPVVLVQLTSFYTDGQVYSLLLIIFCLSVLLYKEFRIWELVMLCLSLLLLVNINFTALLYAIVVMVGFVIILFIGKKINLAKKIAGPIIATLIIGVFVVGYNPYVTNTIETGQPFYPVSGDNAIDIVTSNSPANFIDSNPIKNLARSLLSKSDNQLTPSAVKIPFTVEKSEIQSFISPDVRVGGFGPLFGGTILLGFLVFLILLIQDRKLVWYILLPVIPLLLSILITSESWWARNTPQIWIFPLLVTLVAFLSKKKTPSILGVVILACLLINTLLVSTYHLKSQFEVSRNVETQLDELASRGELIHLKLNNHLSNRIRFQEKNIKHDLVDILSCENPKAIPMSEAQYCE